jgi:hypothetical protein
MTLPFPRAVDSGEFDRDFFPVAFLEQYYVYSFVFFVSLWSVLVE